MTDSVSSESSINAKGTPPRIGSKSVTNATSSNGPQLPPNASHHLISQLRGLEYFNFRPSTWNTHDMLNSDEDNSDNPTGCHHSLLASDYENVTI